jgi:hypothetical protein
MRGCFRLPCAAKKLLALNSWRGALGLFPEALHRFRKALVEGIDLFVRATLHVAAPFRERKAGAQLAFSVTDKSHVPSGDGWTMCPKQQG